ncbi:hypothetical protein CI610_01215 [invertebrate metagenome]|uniref:RING-type domain-containing protein n=1 Tax=invertebrate metagenome TaxID=1711999 RepID=A0A2H9T9E2_9ZZZZ
MDFLKKDKTLPWEQYSLFPSLVDDNYKLLSAGWSYQQDEAVCECCRHHFSIRGNIHTLIGLQYHQLHDDHCFVRKLTNLQNGITTGHVGSSVSNNRREGGDMPCSMPMPETFPSENVSPVAAPSVLSEHEQCIELLISYGDDRQHAEGMMMELGFPSLQELRNYLPALNDNPITSFHPVSVSGTEFGIWRRPQRVDLAEFKTRLESFESWPKKNVLPFVDDLAKAGFYYSGLKDIVRCFFCDGGARNWESCDEPWIIHFFAKPNCPYIEQQLGKSFIDMARESLPDCICQFYGLINQLQEQEKPNFSGAVIRNSVSYLLLNRKKINKNSLKEQCHQFLVSGIDSCHLIRKKALLLDVEEDDSDLVQELRCIICMLRKKCVALLPCRHQCCCVKCSNRVASCPMCREALTGAIKSM